MAESTRAMPIVRRSKLVVSVLNGVERQAIFTCGPDAVVLDMAHGVPRSQRADAQRRVRPLIARLAGRGADIFAWIKASEAKADLEACLVPELAGVVVAVRSAAEVKRVERALDSWEGARGIPQGRTQLDLVLASAAAVLGVRDILAVSKRAVSINLDGEGLASEMGVELSEEIDQLFYPRWRLIFAARLFNIQAHGLTFVVRGASTLDKALLSRKVGLKGALCWDMAEVTALNQGFSYAPEEAERARMVKEAMEEGVRQGLGAVSLPGGVMIDLAMFKHAQVVLSWADAVAQREKARGRTTGEPR